MSALKGLRQYLSIEGAKLLVETDAPSYRQGGEVAGGLLIKGGKYKQICRSITMELEEFWEEVLGSHSKFAASPRIKKVKTHQKLQLAGQTTIMPHSESSYRFKLKLPLNSRPSTQVSLENEDGVGIEAPLIPPQSGWRLKVYLDIPFAVDPWEYIEFRVEPA